MTEEVKLRALTDKQFEKKRKDKEYAELGWYFWNIFLLLPKEDPERVKASAQFDSLTKRERELCEQV